ncbi:MAG: cytochrome c, partial [bacterium]
MLARRIAIAALVVFVISTPAAHAVDESELRQVVGILDYIASDYAGAVGADGTITDESEYHEQASLVTDAGQLAGEAGLSEEDPVRRDLSQLARLLAEHARPDTVHEACRSLRRRIVEEQGLVLEPAGVPDLARARQLYRELGCVDCHGERGDAQTTKAATLDPHPANFLDRERVAEVSPFRAFHALTFGVKGTAMPSFDTVAASDRWDLAFYVLALRHQSGKSEVGRRIMAEAGNPVAATASRLSQLTEREILAAFPNLPSDQGEAVLAWLRGRAPFERDEESRFALARQDLRDGVSAYARGDASAARRILVQAYL